MKPLLAFVVCALITSMATAQIPQPRLGTYVVAGGAMALVINSVPDTISGQGYGIQVWIHPGARIWAAPDNIGMPDPSLRNAPHRVQVAMGIGNCISSRVACCYFRSVSEQGSYIESVYYTATVNENGDLVLTDTDPTHTFQQYVLHYTSNDVAPPAQNATLRHLGQLAWEPSDNHPLYQIGVIGYPSTNEMERASAR